MKTLVESFLNSNNQLNCLIGFDVLLQVLNNNNIQITDEELFELAGESELINQYVDSCGY